MGQNQTRDTGKPCGALLNDKGGGAVAGTKATGRTIHIHVGPHKTGSTAIQHDLRDHGAKLSEQYGLTPVIAPCVNALAKGLIGEDEAEIDKNLGQLVKTCAGMSGDLLISCEDLAGDLPGRTGKRRIYPRLLGNLNRLRRAFPKDNVRFYFFLRAPDAWLRSAYVQLLKHRMKFRSFDGYLSFLNGTEGLWGDQITRVQERLGNMFVTLPYEEGPEFSASTALIATITGDPNPSALPPVAARPNTSPSDDIIALLEVANGSGASAGAVRAAKKSLLSGEKLPRTSQDDRRPDWPPVAKKPDWLAPELESLWKRTDVRAKWQLQPNLLPPMDCDLSEFRLRPVEASDEFPEGGRGRMENQTRILAYRFRRLPETCYLLGLTISYLRRNTGHEAHASHMFQRLWAEEYEVLLGVLPTRWLISAFQTFMDHGVNEDQRMIGSAAYFLANTLKLYEAERALDGLPPDQPYPSAVPTTKSGFWGLDRFRVGGSDLMLNTNALLLELAGRDDRAGRVVQEFMLRLKASNSAFSRMDQSRITHNVDIPQFANCWSFGDPPKLKG